MMRRLFTVLFALTVPAIALAQAPFTGTAHQVQTSNPQPAIQPQQLDTLSQTIGQTDAIQNLEKRLQALEEQSAAQNHADTLVAAPEPSELLDNLPHWLRRWGQWGWAWGILWWIPWFVFSWQWWRRRFWVFAWPWPWWWWIPWLWFIPWLIWGWWWIPVWWGAWIWVWWWVPWIFWLFWWLIVLKHVLQWLQAKQSSKP